MSTFGDLLREKLEGVALPQAQAAAAWIDRTEVIRWWKVSEQLPPLDVDVLCSWGDQGGIYLGAYVQHHGWVGSDGMPMDPPPLYWCALPDGPLDRPSIT